MINVNLTLFFQLANYLLLFLILNFLVFRPILRVLDERKRLVREAGEVKDHLGAKADAAIADYEAKILAAKQEAMEVRSARRSEAMAEYRRQLSEAKDASLKDVEAARQTLARDAESARTTVRADAGKIGAQIASTLMGRAR